jgi:hypothetical protein
VPDQAIALIRGKCAANDCLYPDNVSLGERGAAIVHATPMATGTSARSDGRRVRLLLEIMGRPVKLTVPRERVEAA